MSIIEFAEKNLWCKLSTFHKEFLTKCYEAYVSNKQLYYVPPRGNCKLMPLILQCIAIEYCCEYSGEKEIKEGLDD